MTDTSAQNSQSTWRDFVWPQIADKESARRMTRPAAWLTVLMAVATPLYPFLYGGEVTIAYLIVFGAWAAFLCFVAFGIWRMWRPVALLALVGYSLVAVLSLADGSKGGLVMLLFVLLYGRAVRGAFGFHSLKEGS